MTATTYVALLDGGKREETLRVEAVGPGIYEVTLLGATHRVDAFHHECWDMGIEPGWAVRSPHHVHHARDRSRRSREAR